jgi:hypothetical protein
MAVELKEQYNNNENNIYASLSYGDQYERRYDARTRYIDTEFKFKINHSSTLLGMPYFREFGFTRDGTYIWKPTGDAGPENRGGAHGDGLSDTERFSLAAEYLYANASKQNPFNLGIALAESKETIGLIAYTARRLANAYRALRKGQIDRCFGALGIGNNTRVPYHLRGFGRSKVVTGKLHKKALRRRVTQYNRRTLSKFAADSWLELRYGWNPLIYDVYGSAEYIANLLYRDHADLYLPGVYTYKGKMTPASDNWTGAGYSTVCCRYDSAWKITNPTLRESSSLGLTNPILIAWELVPFSFVADWFLPIGNWIESFTALQGLEPVWCTKTSFSHSIHSYGTVETYYIANGENAIGDYGRIERRTTSAPAIPLPRFSLLERINGDRILDAISLLRQVFK